MLTGAVVCAATLAPRARAGTSAADAPGDLMGLSIEKLMSVEVTTVSQFPQKAADAPASVDVITAEDVRRHGYRTLADILRSVPGFYVTYDRNYQYLGVRGFDSPGNYGGRVLILIDGFRVNDPIYQDAAIGTEFPLDVDMIDRVEVMAGPGSAVYGSNAFLAVVNVITRRGADLHGAEVKLAAGSQGTWQERASLGRVLDNGADLLLSATNYDSRGQDLHYPEFDSPATHNGIAQGLDGDRYQKFLGKLAYAGWSLETGYSTRTKHVPTASFQTVFNDPNFATRDAWGFAALGYRGDVAPDWRVNARGYYGNYAYDGTYPYAGTPVVLNIDGARAAWAGGDVKFTGRLGRNTLVLGGEFQDAYRQDQYNFNQSPYASYLNDRRHGRHAGIYAEDEFPLSSALTLNAGLRYDTFAPGGDGVNPRLGLIWRSDPDTTFKFLYGQAFRVPSVYELFYAMPGAGGQQSNPALTPERVTSYEIDVAHRFGSNTSVSADVYRNNITDLINQVVDPVSGMLVFQNIGRVRGEGADVALQYAAPSGYRGRASYSWQLSRDAISGAQLVASPRQMIKLDASAPLGAGNVALEAQYVGRQTTLNGTELGGFTVVNLTWTRKNLVRGVDLTASVANLFDKSYADPGRPEHVQNAIAQDGRTVWIGAVYHFDAGR